MRKLCVGLTGGIGSGKSLALAEFARLGATTLSSDEVARRQARPGGPAYRRIVRSFGRAVLGRDRRIDRARLAAAVFAHPAKRLRLERLTHPLILDELRRRACRAKGLVVVDVPLLFERSLEKDFHATIAITAPARVRAARVARRDGGRPGDARRRMAAQLSDAERASRADVVISNAGTPAEFLRKVRSYHRALDLMTRSPSQLP